MAPPR